MESRAALAPAPSVLASSRVAYGYVGAAIAAELKARKICARRRQGLTIAPSSFTRRDPARRSGVRPDRADWSSPTDKEVRLSFRRLASLALIALPALF